MDLETRKYHLIKEIFSIDRESIMDSLERVLKLEKERSDISQSNQEKLDTRLENYTENPSDVLDWEKVKKNW